MNKFVRYRTDSKTRYGLLDGHTITELNGDIFSYTPANTKYKLDDVELLAPCEPTKILAVGRNYKTHLKSPVPGAAALPDPKRPEVFFKPNSSIQHPDGPIVVPADSTDLHFEGELVLVIGRRLRHASKEEASEAIFGGTCGNDVSERNWQRGPDKDVQWWRAKGSDTFSPFGPVIATGLNFDNLRLQTRLNGEAAQDQSTADMIFDCATMVSFISRYITLEPGDIIYTGTPGQTRPMKPGDSVEVELEGIGILRNPVVAGQP